MGYHDDYILIVYSVSLCSVFMALFLYHFRSEIVRFKDVVKVPLLSHLMYRPVFRAQRIRHWSRADIVALMAWLGVVGFCLAFKSKDVASVGIRAARLSILHMVPLYGTPHLDPLSDLFGLSWRHVHRLHASFGLMAASLLVVHLIVTQSASQSFPLQKPENIWAVISASSIGALLLLSGLRKRLYEGFLRLHQSLAILSIYGIWVHLAPQTLLPRIYLYVLVGVCGVSLLSLSGLILRRNGLVTHGVPRATISHSDGVVLVHVALSRPIHVEAGQYINIWFPISTTSIRALTQSHPFVVASWSDTAQTTLDLLIEPRGGLTLQLLHRSRVRTDPCRILFSGPHGCSVPVGEYELVLMAASGFGIAAQLPYLKRLLHGYNSRKIRTRRIHLVWELKNLDLPMAIEELLNNALDDDTLDHGYILQISVYVEQAKRDDKLSQRANVIKGLPDWDGIIRDEAAGKYIKRVQEESNPRENMIVTASASPRVRADLQDIVRRYVGDGVEMVELDYQPGE